MTHALNPDFAATTALRLIGPDPQNWVPDREGVDHNVVLVGGGQTGTALAFALRRAGIGKVSVIDTAEDEDRAGVWLTAARMNLLRTPKGLPGPELGIPALGFQSWYEARHGEAAYAAIDRIPRVAWADYLSWFRQFLQIGVRYRTHLVRIEPADGCFRLHLEIDGRPVVETTRKVVLATGFTGNGGAYIPPVLSRPASGLAIAHPGQYRFCGIARQDRRGRGCGCRRIRCGRRGAGKRRRFGASVCPTAIARLSAHHAFAWLSRCLRQLPSASGCDPLASGDPLSTDRIHPDDRCDRAVRRIPAFFIFTSMRHGTRAMSKTNRSLRDRPTVVFVSTM